MEMKQTELAKELSIVWHPHPITPSVDRQNILWTATEGHTVRQMLLAAGVDPYQPIVITLDDRLLTVEEWDVVCPVAGQMLSVKATVQGGDGSNPLQIVAMIALIVVATAVFGPAGTFAATYGATAAAIASAVVMVAGSLLIGAIFPPKGIDSSNAYEQASPTYSLTGSQNRARPYESMPVVMGTHRVVFDYASRPYTEYKSEDQYLYQIFHGGVSPTRYSDYKIGTNPLANYSDVELFFPSDNTGSLKNFPGNVDSLAGAPLTNSAGWITRTSSLNAYQLGVDIEAVLFYANDEGGLDSTSVEIEIAYKATSSEIWLTPTQIFASSNDVAVGSVQTVTETQDQGYWDADSGDWVDNFVSVSKQKFVAGSGGLVVLTSNTQKPRRVSLTFAVAEGEYDVRVRRNTADSTDSRLNNTTNWSVLKTYQVDNTNYTGQTRIAMSIRASEQLNGTVSQFSALGESDAQYWNGTAFVVGATSNPAHIFTHFALGLYNADGKLMYGVGLPSAQLDLVALHAWAQFCTTEGLSFNAVLDGNQTAADVLNAISRCGLASPTWASGKLGVVWDYPNATPVASFGMSNIIRDSFEVAYINEQLAEEIVVRYRNPDKDWEQDEVRVLAPGVTDPLRSSAVDLFGCTNATMAGKFANYLAAQQYYRRRRIVWEADFEGFVCQRGDVVLLSHDLTQWGYSGRIVSVQGLTVTLDRAVPRNGSTEYLMITEPDGTMTTYTTTAESGEDNTITLTNFPVLQEGYSLMDHRWSFSPLATPGKKVKIISIDPVSESRVKVTATDEFPEFYTAWGGTFIEPPDLTLLPSPIVEANNLTVVSRIAVVNGYRTNRVTASWGIGGGVLYSRVRAYFNGDLIAEVPEALVQSFEYDVYAAGDFYIEITPFGVLGAGETITSTLTLGALDAPPPPTAVTLTVGEDGKAATYTWDAVAGVQSYVIQVVVSGTSRRTVNVGNTLTYTYTLDDAIADGGAVRAYEFRVYSVSNSIQSLTYASANFSNPQIGALTGVSLSPLPLSLLLEYDRPSDADFAGVQVWISTDTSFTPSEATLIYDGTSDYISIESDALKVPLAKNTTYFVYVAGYDTYGKDNLTLSAKLNGMITSIDWDLIDAVVTEDVLSLGLNERINLIDTAGDPDMPFGLIQAVRREATDINLLDNAVDTIGQKLLEAELKVQENTDLLYDAGVTVDSTTGEVYIYAVRQAENELNEVDIRLSAAESNILLRATTTYVDEQIATAVIDPSQIAELGALTTRVSAAEVEIDGLNAAVTLKADLLTVNSQGARLTTAEADIDALEGEITLKADNTDLTSVDARVSTVEFQLNTLDVPSITQSVTDTKYIAKNQDQLAETQLKDILTGQANYEALDYGTAVARQDLTAYTDGKILAEATARLQLSAQLNDVAASLDVESIARATADSALSTQITTLAAETAGNAASISNEITARTTADSALATSISTLAVTVGNNGAAITNEATVRANADSALSTQIATLSSVVNGNIAAISSEAITRANADNALSTQITNLSSTVNNNNNTQTAAIQSEATTRANADSALSSSITTLQTTVNGQTTSIQTNASSINGIEAKYTVKIDNNGYVSGYGLISTANNGTPTSSFVVSADRFAIASTVSTSPTGNLSSPFFVLTAPQVIEGKTFAAGVYIKKGNISTIEADSITTGFLNANRIQVGSIDARIASISNAQIANLDAGKITSGFISADRISTGSIDAKIASISSAQIGSLDASKITSGFISADRIATGSIDAKIATISNAQISALDAGKINTGTLSADRIAAGSIDAKIAVIDGAKITNATISTAKIGEAQIDTLRIANNAVTTQVIFERTDFSSDNNTKSLVVPSGQGGTVIINLYCKPFSQPDMFINGVFVLSAFGLGEYYSGNDLDYQIYPYFYNAPAGSFTITIYDDGVYSGTRSKGWIVHTLLTQR